MSLSLRDCKQDNRPQRYGWAPGNYICRCVKCEAGFIGDKRAVHCADCAYAMPEEGTNYGREMSEATWAVILANRVLDRVNADPDDDLAILARQLLRLNEPVQQQTLEDVMKDDPKNPFGLGQDGGFAPFPAPLDALMNKPVAELKAKIERDARGQFGPSMLDVTRLIAIYEADIECLKSSTSGRALTEPQIKHMVNRFLGWRLPENFNPDCGISFQRTHSHNGLWGPQKFEPAGTNLFDATQAEAMVRHMIEGMPCPKI